MWLKIILCRRLKDDNVPTVAYSDSFGNASNGLYQHYLAAACSQVYVQRRRQVNLTGASGNLASVSKLSPHPPTPALRSI